MNNPVVFSFIVQHNDNDVAPVLNFSDGDVVLQKEVMDHGKDTTHARLTVTEINLWEDGNPRVTSIMNWNRRAQIIRISCEITRQTSDFLRLWLCWKLAKMVYQDLSIKIDLSYVGENSAQKPGAFSLEEFRGCPSKVKWQCDLRQEKRARFHRGADCRRDESSSTGGIGCQRWARC